MTQAAVKNQHAHFLRAFLRNPSRIGAIAPSSAVLAREMTRDLNVATDECVIEFGPGTGPFTQALGQVLPDASQYLGIERDMRFVEHLESVFPAMRFVGGSAENAHAIHSDVGLGRVAAIICGLPFASLPAEVQDGVIDSLDQLLTPGSEFRTFQYVHAYQLPAARRFRRLMAGRFGPLFRSRPVLRNLPPAYVLRWKRQVA